MPARGLRERSADWPEKACGGSLSLDGEVDASNVERPRESVTKEKHALDVMWRTPLASLARVKSFTAARPSVK